MLFDVVTSDGPSEFRRRNGHGQVFFATNTTLKRAANARVLFAVTVLSCAHHEWRARNILSALHL
jgi:hypothetical protein